MDYEKEIEERLERLRSRRVHAFHLMNPDHVIQDKEKDRLAIAEVIKLFENALPEFKALTRELKKYAPKIWEQSPNNAALLLFGKTYSNLEVILELAKKGRSAEVMELARSAMESLDLALLFMEEESKENLTKWFKGEIIRNKHARKQLHATMNEHLPELHYDGRELPIESMKAQMYHVYSAYTHSGYVALLDSHVDPFREDLDHEQNAGFHYARENLHIIKTVAVYMSQQMKFCFLKNNDLVNYQRANTLYESLGMEEATQEEIEAAFKKRTS